MVPAKQLHLPVMGVSMLSCNLHKGCKVTAYQYRPTQYKVLQTQQNLKINNLFFSPKCFSFYAHYQGEIYKNTHGKYQKNTMFTNLYIIITHVG